MVMLYRWLTVPMCILKKLVILNLVQLILSEVNVKMSGLIYNEYLNCTQRLVLKDYYVIP